MIEVLAGAPDASICAAYTRENIVCYDLSTKTRLGVSIRPPEALGDKALAISNDHKVFYAQHYLGVYAFHVPTGSLLWHNNDYAQCTRLGWDLHRNALLAVGNLPGANWIDPLSGKKIRSSPESSSVFCSKDGAWTVLYDHHHFSIHGKTTIAALYLPLTPILSHSFGVNSLFLSDFSGVYCIDLENACLRWTWKYVDCFQVRPLAYLPDLDLLFGIAIAVFNGGENGSVYLDPRNGSCQLLASGLAGGQHCFAGGARFLLGSDRKVFSVPSLDLVFELE